MWRRTARFCATPSMRPPWEWTPACSVCCCRIPIPGPGFSQRPTGSWSLTRWASAGPSATGPSLPDSYTRFQNKIGLADSSGQLLSASGGVTLVFPYKDCVLEGGQTREDQRRGEDLQRDPGPPRDRPPAGPQGAGPSSAVRAGGRGAGGGDPAGGQSADPGKQSAGPRLAPPPVRRKGADGLLGRALQHRLRQLRLQRPLLPQHLAGLSEKPGGAAAPPAGGGRRAADPMQLPPAGVSAGAAG